MRYGRQGKPKKMYHTPKMFDAPYIQTICAQGGGSIRYQLLPANVNRHTVDAVYHYVTVNIRVSKLKVTSGYFHCETCKLMGSIETFRQYHCLG